MALTSSPVASFQQVVGTSAKQLPNVGAFTVGVTFTAISTNAANVFIGGIGVTSATGYPLAPGTSVLLYIANANQAYVVGLNTSDVLAGIGA